MNTRAAVFSILIILAAGWWGCTKEAEREFARIRTLDVTRVDASGAVLNGLISNYSDHNILECGFLIYSRDPASGGYLGSLTGEPDNNGSFSVRIELGMFKDTRYYFMAYAISGGITSVGNVNSFISGGAMSPQVKGFQPLSASHFDTIVIELNKNLGALDGLEAEFDDHPAKLVDFRDNLLRVLVPSGLDSKSSTINLTYRSSTSSAGEKFELLSPVINYLSGYEAYPGEVITIAGNYFHPLPSCNIVKFNNIQSEVVSSSKTELRVRVPDTGNENNTVTVTVAGQVATAPELFLIPTPSIISFSKNEAFPGEIISIYGPNFHEVRDNNTVRFNGTIAVIMKATQTRLDVMVPNMESSDCIVTVTVLGQTAEAPGTFKILARPVAWQRMADFTGGNIYKMASFVIGNYAYMGVGTYINHNYNLKFWKYDPSGDSYSEVAPFPGPTRVEPRSFSIDGIGYVGGGFDLDNSSRTALRDFYKYNPGTNTWTLIDPYPGDLSNIFLGLSAVVGSKAYISSTPTDFYSFEPSTGTWTQLTVPATGLYSHTGTFVIGNTIYFVCGQRSDGTSVNELWSYDVLTGNWSRKADFPGQARKGGYGFSIGDNGFYGFGLVGATSVLKDMWIYDPSVDNWTMYLNDFPGTARVAGFAVVVDGKAYIGCGFQSVNSLARDVYRFDAGFLQ
ncbi:MAG: IPT/TIG domain-containing protein [Bacteroidales bacterium]|jgi:N-acetylneuraminic acid mutarotase|nr:IPT/TIG domain-containing protein [Bacteroidales bacterium]